MVAVALWTAAPVGAVSSSLVISQVYGGGGNSGATLTNDFIELYNSGTVPVDLAGWTVQYRFEYRRYLGHDAADRGRSSPVVTSWYRKRSAQAARRPLPTPDAVGTLAMSATAGKVALASSTRRCPAAVPPARR